MNGEWFEAKIKYEKEQENGLMKKVSENYLVDALTFSEAEARIIEELRPYMRGEFEVADLKKVRYVELLDSENEEDDLWFKGKLVIITLDEKTAKEKREFYIPRLNRERSLYGTEFEVKLRNELTQKAIARECAEWIRKKATFKSNSTQEGM